VSSTSTGGVRPTSRADLRCCSVPLRSRVRPPMTAPAAGGRVGAVLHRGAVIDRRPLVGRTAELAAAVGLLEGATAGRARALLVTGEAGIGKTALVREVCRLSGGAAEVIWGSCLPLASRAVPFGTAVVGGAPLGRGPGWAAAGARRPGRRGAAGCACTWRVCSVGTAALTAAGSGRVPGSGVARRVVLCE